MGLALRARRIKFCHLATLPEDESEHGGAEAVAEAAHARHHALHEALLVRRGVHRHERRDRGEGYAERQRDDELKKKTDFE